MFENQVRQLYVAKKRVSSIADEGDIRMLTTPDGKYIYFQFKDKGGVGCTDKIAIKNIRDVVVCKPVGTPIHQYFIQLNDDPKAGETYILRIVMKNIGGIESRKLKEAVAYAKTSTTKDDLYDTLISSFYKNFSREPENPFTIGKNGVSANLVDSSDNVLGAFTPLKSNVKVKVIAADAVGSGSITVATSSGVTTVTIEPKSGEIDKTHIAAQIAADTDAKNLIQVDSIDDTNWPTSTDTVESDILPFGITIQDKTPNYREGLIDMVETQSEIFCDEININAGTSYAPQMEPWGTVTKSTSYTGNARKTAAMERFAMKQRGEINGWLGYPQCNPAQMMINNPGVNDDYWYMTIKYFYQGEGMVNTNSDKELVIVVSNADEVTNNGVFAKKGTSGTSGSLMYGIAQLSGTDMSNDAYTICSVSSNNSLLKDLNTLGIKARLVKY